MSCATTERGCNGIAATAVDACVVDNVTSVALRYDAIDSSSVDKWDAESPQQISHIYTQSDVMLKEREVALHHNPPCKINDMQSRHE